jgi:hypothetical protein
MDDQERKMDSLEQWEHLFTWLVVAGVALEYLLTLLPWHLPAAPIGTTFIVLGISGEIYFGNRVSRIQKDLHMKLQGQIAAGKFGAW